MCVSLGVGRGQGGGREEGDREGMDIIWNYTISQKVKAWSAQVTTTATCTLFVLHLKDFIY